MKSGFLYTTKEAARAYVISELSRTVLGDQ